MAKALDRDIRRLLDKAVRRARLVAEDGARKALTELGVEDAKRPYGLSSTQVDLRNRLRAHARSLDANARQPDDGLKAHRLVREIAYEHWHRALFARFLAESNLLIDPEHKVAVSLAELELIAKEEGRDLVELTADWAEPMLPQIFREDDPVLALALPPETKAGIVEIVKALPRAVFEADDSLGWAYQFWQADYKERINESEVKIGADELPAVTQLFTEDYMVLFLHENTLGAWWAGKCLAADPELAAKAKSEDELRERTSPPGYLWTYLRFVREPLKGETQEVATGPWRPAAGSFEGWPKAAKDITVLDPCMGSGHFLVFALPILVAVRRAEEGLDERTALRAVLADNLYGLEIDPRCTQIAAFALALASWKRLGGPEPLPRLNLACSGLAIGLGKEEFLKLAERIAAKRGWKPSIDLLGDGATPLESAAVKREREGLSRLYDLFEKAPSIGSLIDPVRASSDLFASGYEELAELLANTLEAHESIAEVRETAVTAQGLATAAALLSRHYVLVATNVPYLGRAKMDALLGKYVDEAFPEGRTELATAFLIRIFSMLTGDGCAAIVSPQNWLFLATFSELRSNLLSNRSWHLVAKLGPAAFQDMNWWAAVTSLNIISRSKHDGHGTFCSIDLGQHRQSGEKAALVTESAVHITSQTEQLKNPKFAIVVSDVTVEGRLCDIAVGTEGLSSGDSDKFVRAFWERPSIDGPWEALQRVPEKDRPFDGLTDIILWEHGAGELSVSDAARVQGHAAWGRPGVLVSAINRLRAAGYMGGLYDKMGVVITPKRTEDLDAVWKFCRSENYYARVRELSQKAHVATDTLTQVPIDDEQLASRALVYPKPTSNDPTQWIFDGHPRGSGDPNLAQSDVRVLHSIAAHEVRVGLAEHPLQIAVARLLGYRWPRQNGSSFMGCPAVTAPDEIDQSGLIDSDGIVSLSALAGEVDAAARLRGLIRAFWGENLGESTIRELLAAEEAKAIDLTTWLADEFFDGHCKLFHQTPFIWHVWDGVRGGFSALVNYHRLCDGNGGGRRLLEKMRDTYLGEWIAAQRRAHMAGEVGAEERLIAAEHLRGEMTKIIEGEPPYDIFVRWKPLHRQPIGWEPDIDDGLRLNIRPFLTARPKNPRGRDACILRVTPRVKKYAGADRGAEPLREKEDFPWFWAEDADVAKVDFVGGPEFRGRRYNDFHFSRMSKQRARDVQGKKS